MRGILAVLLPSTADNTIRGMKLPFYVFEAVAILSLARSCIHLFAPDGGAGSIAGMILPNAGVDGVVFAFALWGSAQFVYAVIQLVAAFRYRSLVPLLWLLVIVEILLRLLVGHMKPVSFVHTPPGAIGNFVLLPLAALMLALSLWSGGKTRIAEPAPARRVTG